MRLYLYAAHTLLVYQFLQFLVLQRSNVFLYIEKIALAVPSFVKLRTTYAQSLGKHLKKFVLIVYVALAYRHKIRS